MKKCPNCRVVIKIAKEKISALAVVGIGFIGEVLLVSAAILLAVIFSITSFALAYVIALLIAIVMVLGLSSFKKYYCHHCEKYYSEKDISEQ